MMPLGNLPHPLTAFFGREDEIRAAAGALGEHRLVTLVGPGGVGKTRMAIEVARALAAGYADGTWFVDLSALRDGDRVASVIRACLGATETHGDPLLETIGLVHEQSMLVVLDNCEQVIGDAATAVHRLLEACPKLRVLATSREPLGVPGEAVHRLAPLSLPADSALATVESLTQSSAVNLFLDRARLVNPEFALRPDNVAAVMRICSALDGLPLATELAAARVRTIPVEQLAARLTERLPLLTGGPRTAPERQRTVEAAVRWSYDLLSEPEKTLFRRLAVFSSGWTLEAAEGICAFAGVAEADVFPLVDALVDRSLVVATPEGDGRFRFLEVILEFARNELQASGEAETLGARHCRWFAELAARAEPHLDRESPGYWLDLLDADAENFWAALAWSRVDQRCYEVGLRIAANLIIFWNHRGHLARGREVVRDLLDAGAAAAPSARVGALLALAWSANFMLANDEGEKAAAEAIELARELGDDRLLARGLHAGGLNRLLGGSVAGAATWIEEGVVVARRGGAPLDLGLALSALEMLQAARGQDDEAAATLAEAMAVAREQRAPRLEALLSISLGERARLRGDLAAAQRSYERARETAASVGIARLVSLATVNLAATAIRNQDRPAALAALGQIFSATGGVEGQVGVFAVGLAGALEAEAGDAARATRWLASFESTSHVDFTDRPIIDAALLRCRERLGPEFEAAFARGAGVDPRTFWQEASAVIASSLQDQGRAAVGNLAGLSPREVEILRLVAGGSSNQDIADQLLLSRRTVETHIANAYAKIGAHNRAEAVRFAIQHGLAALPA